MKKFSKLFWVALVVAAVLACTALGVFAAEVETTSTAVVYGEIVKAADSFSVDFNFKNNNTKVECGKITLTWDSNKMSATSIDAADGALSDAQFGYKIEDGKAVIAWAGSSIDGETDKGTLFTVNFKKESMAADGYATVNVSVDNFGYTKGFTAKELKNDVKQSGALIEGENVTGVFEYTSETTETPAEILEYALAYAKDGKDAYIIVSSKMEFTQDIAVGESSYSENSGNVYITSVYTENDGVKTAVTGATTERPAAGTGIIIYADAIVNVYGNLNFNNILFGTTQYVYNAKLPTTKDEFNKGTGKNSYSSGGCFNFAAGLGTFGLAENQGTADAPDFGYIGVCPDVNALKLDGDTVVANPTAVFRPHVAGYVKVYAGEYNTISGNYCNSGVTIDNPNVYVGGTTNSLYVFGGAHNGDNKTNPVTSTITLTIEGYANVTDASVGSWYSGTNQIGGSGTVGGNAKITNMCAGFVGSGTINEGKKYTFTITSDDVEINLLSGHRFNAEGNASTNVEMTLSQGKIGTIYGGFCSKWAYDSKKPDKHGELYGDIAITISEQLYSPANTGEIINNVVVYAGSEMNHNRDIHGADTVLTVSGIEGEYKNNSMVFYMGSKMSGNSKGSEHSGNTTATFTDVNLTMPYESGSWAAIMASAISSESTHSGEVYITLKNFNASKRVVGGSYLNAAGATHSGKSTVKFEGTSANYKSDNYKYIDKDGKEKTAYNSPLVMGGSICFAANTTHSGNSTVILAGVSTAKADAYKFTTYGGSVLYNTNTEHTGTSEVQLLGGRTDGNTFGGSLFSKPETKQTNDSKVTINGVINVMSTVYGGSKAEAYSTTTYPLPDESKKAQYGHLANSTVDLVKGYVDNLTVHGGSNFEFSTDWIKQGYVVQGLKDGTSKTMVKIHTGKDKYYRDNITYQTQIYGSARLAYGGYQYGDAVVDIDNQASLAVKRIAGAYLNGGAELIGNTSVIINSEDCDTSKDGSIRFVYADSGNNTAAFVFGIIGGAYGTNGKLTGNSSLTIKNASLDSYGNTLIGNAASAEIVGGSFFTNTDGLMTGNSTLTLDGVEVGFQVKTTNNSDTFLSRRIIGGCYGAGTMVGNSTLKLMSDTNIELPYTYNSSTKKYNINNTYSVISGCYGTNDITTEKDLTTGIYGGIRQKGDVEFIVQDNVKVNTVINVSGEKSNVDGNVTIKVSGTPEFSYTFTALGYREYYSSITGDVKAYISGGTFKDQFLMGGRISTTYTGKKGYDFVGGNTYVEISGGTFKNVIASAGESGVIGDSYLKFVGDIDVASSTGVYPASWSASYLGSTKTDRRDILDLSLVTDIAGNYQFFTKAWEDKTGKIGNASGRGFSVVYPSLYDASALTVTLTDSEIYPGKVLESADTLAITYATPVNAHNGVDSAVPYSSFNGTVARLCEYDAWADAKTIDAFKYFDEANTEAELVVPASPVGFTTTKLIVKAGSASAPAVTVRHGFRMAGAALTLQSDLSIKVKIKDAIKATYEDVKLVAVDEYETERVIADMTWDETERRWVFAYKNISPQKAGDLISFKITAKYGEESVETAATNYGVITYCNNQLSNSKTSDTLKTLIVDLLNYAAKAQVYRNYKTDKLVNANLTPEQQAYASKQMETVINAQDLNYKTIENPTITWRGAALTLNDKIDLKVVIQVPEGVDVKTLTMKVVVEGKAPVLVPCSDEFEGSYTDRYAQRFDQLKPYELRTPILLTILDSEGNEISNTVKYSAASYVHSGAVNKSESLKALVEAMIMYGDSTKEQFGK